MVGVMGVLMEELLVLLLLLLLLLMLLLLVMLLLLEPTPSHRHADQAVVHQVVRAEGEGFAAHGEALVGGDQAP